MNCTKCSLWLNRKTIVNGSGNINANILIIGEAPGHVEDKYGIPFIGKSGKLLDKYLKFANLDRFNDIYIVNVVRCRPIKNATPSDSQIATCKEYLFNDIKVVKPKIIVPLGTVATNVLLEGKISKLQGKVYNVGKFIIIPMFHPSYILQSGEEHYYSASFKVLVNQYLKLNINHKSIWN